MQLSLRGSLGTGSEIWAFCEIDENEGKQEEVWGRFWQVRLRARHALGMNLSCGYSYMRMHRVSWLAV